MLWSIFAAVMLLCVFHAWGNRDSVAQYSIKQGYFCRLFRVSRAQISFRLYFLNPRNRYALLFTLFLFCTSQAFSNLSRTRHFFSLCSIFSKAYSLIHLNSDLLPSLVITLLHLLLKRDGGPIAEEHPSLYSALELPLPAIAHSYM